MVNKQNAVVLLEGGGSFKLHPMFQHHEISIDVWAKLSEENREVREKKFQSDKGKTKANVIVSRDGQRTVVTTPSAGRKPHPVKRKRSERSRTPKAKRPLIQNTHH